MLTEQRKRELMNLALPDSLPMDRAKSALMEALNTAVAETERNVRTVLATKFDLMAQWHYATADATGQFEHVHFAQAFAESAAIARGDE